MDVSRRIAAAHVPVRRLPAQQQRLSCGGLSDSEVRARFELFQNGRVRVLDVRPVQGAAHAPQHRYIILRQTCVCYALKRKENKGRKNSIIYLLFIFSF